MSRPAEVWALVADQYAVKLIALTERLLPVVTALERADVDDATMQRYYQIDHLGAQARRLARDLRVLAGVSEGELGGEDAPLLEVLRWAASSVEQYTRLRITVGCERAVAAHAADDLASLFAALLDNATRLSPSTVQVNAWLEHGGNVTVRIDDYGIRFPPARLEALNKALAGPVPPLDEVAGQHTGFPVVHRVAHKLGVNVRLYDRAPQAEGPPPGTTTVVTIPRHLLRLVPAAIPAPAAHTGGPSGRDTRRHDRPVAAPSPQPDALRAAPAASAGRTAGGLPIRVPGSLMSSQPAAGLHPPLEDPVAGARAFFADLAALDATGEATPPPQTDPDHGKQCDDA
jgi:hypothetical protein